jgi:hypothetical protein
MDNGGCKNTSLDKDLKSQENYRGGCMKHTVLPWTNLPKSQLDERYSFLPPNICHFNFYINFDYLSY